MDLQPLRWVTETAVYHVQALVFGRFFFVYAAGRATQQHPMIQGLG